MTFAELLQQVSELLQRQGRVSYRALQTAFDLNDEDIKELQATLIQVRQVASDADGVALVWRSPALPTAPSAFDVAAPPPGSAERRQLTVMCCDLIGTAAVLKHRPPSDAQTLLHAYETACDEVITRFGGYPEWHEGHGLRVYFGYPQAHEDDAPRAVHAALELIAAVRRLHMPLQPHTRLAVRIGIHTDLAVVGTQKGDMGSGLTVVGDTLHMTVQLRDLAAQNTVVISPATYRLVHKHFICHELGQHRFNTTMVPVQVYRVVGPQGGHRRPDLRMPLRFTPLVGRQDEIKCLQEYWQRARQDTRQVVVLGGEVGIGKSRLAHVLQEYVAPEPHLRWECRAAPYYQNSAFYPLIDALERMLQWRPGDTPEEKRVKLETVFSRYDLDPSETVPLLATLLSCPLPPERYARLALPPQRQRQKTLTALLTLVQKLTQYQPTLFIVEDLQWLDPSTLEFLDLLITQGPTSRLLLLLTCRPDFTPPWRIPEQVTYLPLQRLSPPDTKQMIMQIAGGKALPTEMLDYLVEKTDGVPLFIEELTKAVIDIGLLHAKEDHYDLMGPLPRLTIPTTLQGSLMARLDQSAAVKAVAQLGATIGRTFTAALLRDISPFDATILEQGLQQLVTAKLLFQDHEPPYTTYMFKHALIQDVAYQSLLRATRQDYHTRIAQALEAKYPEMARQQPELLAHHLTEAGLSAQAIPYWQRAAQQAIKRSAHVETLGHLTQALSLLTSLPDTQASMRYELSLQLTLGNTLVKMKGYGTPEVGQAYDRARDLCQQIGDPQQMARVLYGLWVFYLTRAECATARALAEQLLDLSAAQDDPDRLLRGHNALGSTLCFLGEFTQAHRHLEQAMRCDAPLSSASPSPTDATVPQVANFAYDSWALWYLGYPDRALTAHHAACALAQERQHPFGHAIALFFGAILHQLRREADAARDKAEAVISLATELEFAVWVAGGTLVRGWALVMQGQIEEGFAEIQAGLAAWGATGAELIRPSGLAKLAEAYAMRGQPELALDVLTEALAATQATGMRYYEAELHRLRGCLHLLPGAQYAPDTAATSLQDAIAIARAQQAKSLELRAAVDLSRLWQRQGQDDAAYRLLAPIYGWFTEGFDTADLQEAEALLTILRKEPHAPHCT